MKCPGIKLNENDDQLKIDWERCGFHQRKQGLNQETVGNNWIRTGKIRKMMMSWNLTWEKATNFCALNEEKSNLQNQEKKETWRCKKEK
jgi:hypothetical protein